MSSSQRSYLVTLLSLVSVHEDMQRVIWELNKIGDLARLLRHLAANHMLQETSIGAFKPTKFTLALLQPVFGEWINHLYVAWQ